MKSLLDLFRAPALALGVGLIIAATGCDDGSDTDTDTDGDTGTESDTTADTGDTGEISHASDIQPLWDANCVTACHEPGAPAGGLLDLSTDGYAAMVGVTSGQAATFKIVEPNDAAASYLVGKLKGTHMDFEGGFGGQMPAGKDPLSDADMTLISNWIDSGANP